MLTMAQTSSTLFYGASNLDDHKTNLVKNSNGGSIFPKPSPRISLWPSISRWSFTVKASASLVKRTTATPELFVVDANVKIDYFCEMGNLKMALQLLSRRGSQSPEIEAETYCSVLELCVQRKSLKDGKKVHDVISDNGVDIDGCLAEKLVFMYVNCGDLREARRVFDKASINRVFIWNLMINEYSKIRDFRESLSLFKKMRELGIEPNSHTFSCIFKCFAALGSVRDGEKLHGFLHKLGFGSHNSTVANSLISFYFKIGRVESARKVFDKLPYRDIITWNSMISGYASNGLGQRGVEIFVTMVSLGLELDLASLVNVLVACACIKARVFGSAVHGYAIKSNLDSELTLLNTLLDMYAKSGDLHSAVRVFEKMGPRSRTVVSWTSMIAGYAREGFTEAAIELFREMESYGVTPDIFTVTSVLHACASSGSLDNGKDLHRYVKENEMETNLFVSNALMDMYAKCGAMEEARLVFSAMAVRDLVSWNTMIGGYSKNTLPNESLELFFEMQRFLKPDGVTVACILPACASLAALDKGREIHCHTLRNGFIRDCYVANALVDMYVKCGRLSISEKLFDLIPEKDLVLWTVMIAGYGMHGFGREAILTFDQMRKSGIEPDEISYTSILYACSHSGLVKEGWRFFDAMKSESNIELKLEHYGCIVDLLSRAGKLLMAHKFIKSMPIEPDAAIWGALLHGCRTNRDVKLAERVAERVFELEPENTGYYVLLANIYTEAEKWDEVKRMRERIGRRGLRKNPGCSWIEVKGKVSIFVAGDHSNGLSDEIESLLKRVRARMNEGGLLPELKSEAEKEVALCGHSEKLAMAFGILSSRPGKVVRVTKNLRVCGDCHETAKFISKMFAREIVLRDSNRFHHFKDGSCSCRGFW